MEQVRTQWQTAQTMCLLRAASNHATDGLRDRLGADPRYVGQACSLRGLDEAARVRRLAKKNNHQRAAAPQHVHIRRKVGLAIGEAGGGENLKTALFGL